MASSKDTNKTMIGIAIVIVILIIVFYVTRKIKPVPGGVVSSGYGDRTHPIYGTTHFHNGIDISADSGTPIKSILPGEIVSTGYDGVNGNYVKIKNRNYGTFYGHMLEPAKVKPGQRVLKGQIVGYIGSTGMSTGPHTHFIVYDQNWQTMDPQETNLFRV